MGAAIQFESTRTIDAKKIGALIGTLTWQRKHKTRQTNKRRNKRYSVKKKLPTHGGVAHPLTQFDWNLKKTLT